MYIKYAGVIFITFIVCVHCISETRTKYSPSAPQNLRYRRSTGENIELFWDPPFTKVAISSYIYNRTTSEYEYDYSAQIDLEDDYERKAFLDSFEQKVNVEYILYYEEGFITTGWCSQEPVFNGCTLKNNVSVSYAPIRDGYYLRNLKPGTPYTIWVRAYYTSPQDEFNLPEDISDRLGPSSEPVFALTDMPTTGPALYQTTEQPKPWMTPGEVPEEHQDTNLPNTMPSERNPKTTSSKSEWNLETSSSEPDNSEQTSRSGGTLQCTVLSPYAIAVITHLLMLRIHW